VEGAGPPNAIVEREGLAQTSDPSAIEGFVDEVLAANEKVVCDYRAGKMNVLGFLVGQVMKASRGRPIRAGKRAGKEEALILGACRVMARHFR